MKNVIIFLFVIICSTAFSQGSFNLEWQNPSGQNYWDIGSFEKNNSVYEILLLDASGNSLKVYDGNTHAIKYTIPYNYNQDSLGFDAPGEAQYVHKVDFNNDGIYDYIKTKYTYNGSSSVLSLIRIYNGANNALIKEMTFSPLSGYGYRYYEFLDIDGDGYIELIITENLGNNNNNIFIYSTPATVSIKDDNTEIKDYELKQNYPNPFNPATTIEYTLKSAGDVRITLFDVTGREISTLVNQKQAPGSYKAKLDGLNISSGTYFYQLIVNGNTESKKMIMVK
ncbi:MAG: T9SS type A sorting domain-containing protein [Ignavibacteriae bacterium]|nr:T9SS type A sorting domain-containing protein [Ignavibacteriota bacterium]